MKIAIKGATSQIANDLIVSISTKEEQKFHLYAIHSLVTFLK